MLRVVRADNGVGLADALAAVLIDPVGDPLAPEEVVVHSRGMERWLAQHLSRRLGATGRGDGVCAGVVFPFPIDVVRRTLHATGGTDPRGGVWAPDRLVWPLMAAVDRGLPSWADPLTARLTAGAGARFDVLRGIADLFDRYAAHRPDLVQRWVAGADVDAAGDPLGRADVWQPRLLRHLREDLGQPTLAESVVGAIARLPSMAPGDLGDLPPRLSLFGFTALPAAHTALLVALAGVIDVTIYLLHPSPTLWDRWAGVTGTTDVDGLPVLPGRQTAATPRVTNRLLRSWGRDAAELQVVVTTVAGTAVVDRVTSGEEGGEGAATSLLERVQVAVRSDAPAVAAGVVGHQDRSVQVHACVGRARQVQVLRDEILRLLAADPTLEPRDVIVMCPDVETFAPLVRAHLAVPADDPEGRPDLRVRLADRALRQVNPMLQVLDDLLDLAADRLTATRLLDLAASDPVRRRFHLSADDLERLQDWIDQTGIRWGVDAEDRGRDGVTQRDGTVDAGLDRILLGVAMADEQHRTVGAVTPLDGVDSGDASLAGRFAELVDRLGRTLAAFRSDRTMREWATTLTAAATVLMAEPADDPAQRTQLTTLVDDVANTAGNSDLKLSLAEIRSLLGDRLAGQPSWANHRTGDLTVCTLVPMRSVPHRVVCLLGMDDGVFPRRGRPRGDDLIARHPRMGDRDPRSEDRQLLLDALMAAGDAVVITYTGIDDRTGEDRPPCAPVAELLRALDAMVPGAADAVTTRHPLHPYDPEVFQPPRAGFDRQAHRAASRQVDVRPPPATVPPPDVEVPDVVDLDRLVAFTRDPAAHFYRQTVGTWVPPDPEAGSDLVPLDLDGLAQWRIGDLLVDDATVHDLDRVEEVLAAARGRGTMPPAVLIERKLDGLRTSAADIVGLCDQLGIPTGSGARHEVDGSIGDRRLCGTVTGIHGHRQVQIGFSKLKAKSILAGWVRLLALTLDDPETTWEVLLAGRHERDKLDRRPAPHVVRIGPLGATADQRARTVTDLLGDLIALFDDGLREPLVVPPLTGGAYAVERLLRGRTPAEADGVAGERWDHDDHGYDNEADLPAHLLRYGDSVPYEVLATEPPRPQDRRDGRDPEPHRLGGLAIRLWSPVLAHTRAVRP